MSEAETFAFRGASGQKFDFKVYPKTHIPENKAGIFIYAKKLSFIKNQAVFYIPLLIKDACDMENTLRTFSLSSYSEFAEATHFCTYEEEVGFLRDKFYRDLMEQYNEGTMEKKSNYLKSA